MAQYMYKTIATYTNYVYAIHLTPKGVGFPLFPCKSVLLYHLINLNGSLNIIVLSICIIYDRKIIGCFYIKKTA